MAHTWTDAEAETLKAMWNKGHSASEIVAAIPGVTRNSVIGKAYRLGLREHVNAPKLNKPLPTSSENGRAPVKKLARDARVKIAKPDPVKVAEVTRLVERVAALPAPKPLNLTLLELDSRSCRWPVAGEKASTLFCGHPTEDSKSYCTCHVRLSVGRGTESERDAAYIGKAA